MPRRGKLDLDQIHASLVIACPHCTAKIGPEEYKRVDGERLRCPWCGETFVPRRQKKNPTD
jgi:DNA-directed RNA polymerase subunit RPC12/RpoP